MFYFAEHKCIDLLSEMSIMFKDFGSDFRNRIRPYILMRLTPSKEKALEWNLRWRKVAPSDEPQPRAHAACRRVEPTAKRSVFEVLLSSLFYSTFRLQV